MSGRFTDLRFTSSTAIDVFNFPYAVFATDLVYTMAVECRARWNPPGVRNYIVHDFSPFTHAMRQALTICVRVRDEDFYSKYDALVRPDADGKLVLFVDYVRYVFATLIGENRGVADLFLHMVYVARLSFLFHERGTTDAPTFASVLISQAMKELQIRTNGFIYRWLLDLAEGVVETQA